jgi:hypothetical protein
MEHPTNVASIPSESAASNIISPTGPTRRTTRMSGTMVRKVARRSFPLSSAAEVKLVLQPSPPPLSHLPPQPPLLTPQDEDLPIAKRPRLWISTTFAPTHALMTLPSLPKDEMDPAAAVSPVQDNFKGKWTPEEDALLAKAVQKHGKRWVPIAAMVPGRTNPQCRSRWLRHLDPTNGKKGRWTPQEDATLIEAVGKLGKEFTLVAALIPGRTNERCRDRWFRWFDIASIQGLEKGPWTPEEDAKLTEAVQKLGIHWVPVAAQVCTRTNTQCRQRWLDNLDPDRVTPTRSPRSPRSPRKKSTTPGMASKDHLVLSQLTTDMHVAADAIM